MLGVTAAVLVVVVAEAVAVGFRKPRRTEARMLSLIRSRFVRRFVRAAASVAEVEEEVESAEEEEEDEDDEVPDTSLRRAMRDEARERQK